MSKFPNSTEIADFLPQDLKLKNKTVIMQMRNLDIFGSQALEHSLLLLNYIETQLKQKYIDRGRAEKEVFFISMA